MREKWQKQTPLMAHIKDHPQSKELEAISAIIDANPAICLHVLQDLSSGIIKRAGPVVGLDEFLIGQVLL